MSSGNFNVEIEHWMLKLLDAPSGDLLSILRYFGVDQAALAGSLIDSIRQLNTGNVKPPAFSPHLLELAKDAWMTASLDYHGAQTRSGHVLIALLDSGLLSRSVRATTDLARQIDIKKLREQFEDITSDSTEATPAGNISPHSNLSIPPSEASDTLSRFTVDLTEAARQGEIDPVVGRVSEIHQMVDILMRRRQNNPILTGEAGVGKTAIVEGLALLIAKGEVPGTLSNTSLLSLDLTLLQAGASVRGEFEKRVKGVIDGVKQSPVPVILFIDEAHMLIGAGGQAGQGGRSKFVQARIGARRNTYHCGYDLGRIQKILRKGRGINSSISGCKG